MATHSPSPYQVELFNLVATRADFELVVLYFYGSDPARSWSQRALEHNHIFYQSSTKKFALEELAKSDLLVVNWYQDPMARLLIKDRVQNNLPWTFWGERPGFRYPILGKIARRWLLRDLHRTGSTIWGIGNRAVSAYRNEFGPNKIYINLPYFSDLERFSKCKKIKKEEGVRTILFSGSLIPRKGVDKLAVAFREISPKFPRLRLKIMGEGPMRDHLIKILSPVSDMVEFVGFRDWDDLPTVYASADVLCVPSLYDGWGLVVPEGLAAGLPVIATQVMGAAYDLIIHEKNGWLAKPGDARSLSSIIHNVASIDSEELNIYSQRARLSIANHTLNDGAIRFASACELSYSASSIS